MVLYGYEIAVTLAGFETVTKRITIETNVPPKVDFQLVPKGQTETVTVNPEGPGVDLTSSSGGVPTLNASTLKSLVQLNQDFQDALPLLPGVVRGIDGLIRIKGGRTNQANTLVNSASVIDPFTGQAALSCRLWRLSRCRCWRIRFRQSMGGFRAAWWTSTLAAALMSGKRYSAREYPTPVISFREARFRQNTKTHRGARGILRAIASGYIGLRSK